MMPVKDSGIYEAFVPGLASGQLYKYAITTGSGKFSLKQIPMLSPPNTGGHRICDHRYQGI